jgi:hypothetical protein
MGREVKEVEGNGLYDFTAWGLAGWKIYCVLSWCYDLRLAEDNIPIQATCFSQNLCLQCLG